MIGDAMIALLLLNEVRHRIIARIFGVTRPQSNAVTFVAVGLLSTVLHERVAGAFAARPRLSVANTAIGAVTVKEASHAVAGTWSRDAPFFGALIVFAVLARSFGPMVLGTLRGAREAIRGITSETGKVLRFLGGQ
jgi:hypothetical protein